jgi:pyridoxal 5'-phosphate synthase pdxT subunit
MKAGVLALQGSFEPHAAALRRLDVECALVRSIEDLAGLTHLILPGGESTTLHHLLELFGLRQAIRERAARGELALFGTCAGAILMGADDGTRPPRMGLLDATLARNAYGTQVDSFEAPLHVEGLDGGPLLARFIRAPRFTHIGPSARVLARLDGQPVLVEQPGLLAATFHPELVGDDRLHARFLGCATALRQAAQSR